MKVSIVTASYNSAATIEETICSVLDQNGVDVEYLIADGASRDGTADIIRRYDSRLAWWVSEPDGGQVHAINKAFSHATGDVLGFLNADDALTPGALEKVVAEFAANPRSEIVSGAIEWIDIEGRTLGTHYGEIATLEDILDIYGVWWGGRQWVQPEVFFRRELKERVGAFDVRYHLAFDYDFWVRCFCAGARVTRIPERLARFRRHGAQKSLDTERACDEIRAILSEHLASRPKIGAWTLHRLRAELDYDIYKSGKCSPASGSRVPFALAIVQNPKWLLCARVRQRLARCRI
jgi:glycosyltransferase involved in cell wall biosynthesis